MNSQNNSASEHRRRKTVLAELQVKESILLMDFLIKNFPDKNRNNIKTLLKDGQVWVNDVRITQFNHPLVAGNKVLLKRQKSKTSQVYPGLHIIYEDEYFVVIEKSSGILSVSTDKKDKVTAYQMLSEHVKKQNASQKIFVLHRLDRETSGIMMFAKSQKIQEEMQRVWHQRVTERSYLAVVEGHPAEKSGTVSSYLKENNSFQVYSTNEGNEGQWSVTHYETLKTNRHYSLLKVNPETGRKNQIRVHMHDLGIPIAGDKKYGARQNPISRLGLHAWVLAFIHPVTNKILRFESAIPKKFAELFIDKKEEDSK